MRCQWQGQSGSARQTESVSDLRTPVPAPRRQRSQAGHPTRVYFWPLELCLPTTALNVHVRIAQHCDCRLSAACRADVEVGRVAESRLNGLAPDASHRRMQSAQAPVSGITCLRDGCCACAKCSSLSASASVSNALRIRNSFSS